MNKWAISQEASGNLPTRTIAAEEGQIALHMSCYRYHAESIAAVVFTLH